MKNLSLTLWPIFFFVPLMINMFRRIHKHYEEIAEQLRVSTALNNLTV